MAGSSIRSNNRASWHPITNEKWQQNRLTWPSLRYGKACRISFSVNYVSTAYLDNCLFRHSDLERCLLVWGLIDHWLGIFVIICIYFISEVFDWWFLYRSYELMEKVFKVYVYRDGSKPLVHSGPKTGIYASEGQFLERIRRPNNYVVRDPWKAHMFFLPYSVQHMVSHLYVPNSHTMLPLATFIKNYVNSIASRYSFWNRTQGADHFFVSCHDWVRNPQTPARLYWNSVAFGNIPITQTSNASNILP